MLLKTILKNVIEDSESSFLKTILLDLRQFFQLIRIDGKMLLVYVRNISKIIFLIGSLILPTLFINHEIIIILSFIILIAVIVSQFGNKISESLEDYSESVKKNLKIKLKKPNSSPVEEKIQTGSISEDEIQVIKWTPNFVIETQNSLNNYTENLLINYILKSKSNFNRQKFEEIRKNKKKPNKLKK